MALVVDEFFTFSSMKSRNRVLNWNQLENTVVYIFHDAFIFIGNSFYFRMFDKIIDNFIATGIMSHLVENHFTKKIKFEKVEKEPQILSLDDLAFGFNIWFCACLISIIGFIAERALIRKRKKSLFAKVHPINLESEHEICIDEVTTYEITNGMNPELAEKFRVKKQAKVHSLASTEISKDIELIDLEENDEITNNM